MIFKLLYIGDSFICSQVTDHLDLDLEEIPCSGKWRQAVSVQDPESSMHRSRNRERKEELKVVHFVAWSGCTVGWSVPDSI